MLKVCKITSLLLIVFLQNSKLVSDFKSGKLEAEAKKMWDLFYKRNNVNFFKDRHWTFREFEELSYTKARVNSLNVLLIYAIALEVNHA